VNVLQWVIPSLFVGLGVSLLIYQVRFSRNSSAAEGVVIELILKSTRGGWVYRPMVQFLPVEAPLEKVIFESSVGSRPARFRVGDRVSILYNPANPLQAQINSLMDRWLFPGFLIIAGIGSFLLLRIPSFF
jgi:hypothetical protein